MSGGRGWTDAVDAADYFVRPLVILHDTGKIEGTIGALTLLGDGWAATAEHVLDERDEHREEARQSLVYYGGPDAEVVEEIPMEDDDLVLLKLDPDPLGGGAPPLWTRTMERGAPVCALGMTRTPKDRFIDRERRKLVRLDPAPQVPAWPAAGMVCAVTDDGRIVVDLPGIVPSFSGGPLVDARGRIAGIITEGGPAKMESLNGKEFTVDYMPTPSPEMLARRFRAEGVPVRTEGPLRAAWRRLWN